MARTKRHTAVSIGLAIILTLVFILIFCVGSITPSAKTVSLISAIIESDDIEISPKRQPIIRNEKIDKEMLKSRLRSESGEQHRRKMKLSFFVPFDTTTHADFLVQNSDKYYYMKPTRTVFRMGFYTFTWSAAIIDKLNLQVSDLDGFGYSSGAQYSERFIIPVILHDSELPPKIEVQAYSFIFAAGTVGRAKIRIQHSKTQSILFETQTGVIPRYSRFLVQWRLDGNSTPTVPEGELVLSVAFIHEGSLRAAGNYTYIFNHKHLIETDKAQILSGDRYEGVRLYEDI